jgi:hypothetical protein
VESKRMNFKKSALASAITLATFATGAAAFDASSWEVSGFVKNETAALQKDGTFIGQATTSTSTADLNDSGDVIKSESTAKVFINGDLTENAALHAELNLVYDSEADSRFDSHLNYSQSDFLRELYVDTSVGDAGDVYLRLGKQQVVWGTADGMKLLDIINPTDYREFAQNSMEDSRIPVWMVTAEKDLDQGGNFQFLVSQSKPNVIAGLGESSSAQGATGTGGSTSSAGTLTNAGLHTNSDSGATFIMKGVDTITGKVNGFLNMTPAMGAVAAAFDRGALYDTNGSGANADTGGLFNGPKEDYVSLQGYTQATVNEFATGGGAQAQGFLPFCASGAVATSASCLSDIVNNSVAPNGANLGANNGNAQNLLNVSSDAAWTAGLAAPTQMFMYMPEATFATFDNFVNMKSKYVVDHNDDPLIGARYKSSTDNGTNYSLNVLYGNDPNPYIEMEWQDNSGNHLYENHSSPSGTDYHTVHLSTTDGSTTNTVGGYQANTSTSDFAVAGTSTDVATLVMTEKLNKVLNLGTSFDTTLDTESFGGVVIRGEFLYQKDVMKPVITRKATSGIDLNHGFLVSSVKMEKADMFKYVVGADITVLTNMLVSGQFIQERNLDYVDIGNKDASDWKYTADMASMHVTNNLQKAEENKEFYSLFLSKPFGANQLGRWNNIFIFEEGGGKWNRFDVEYSFSDELVGSFELNNYWGDTNTQFGQMEDSSNIQVGLKYIF